MRTFLFTVWLAVIQLEGSTSVDKDLVHASRPAVFSSLPHRKGSMMILRGTLDVLDANLICKWQQIISIKHTELGDSFWSGPTSFWHTALEK